VNWIGTAIGTLIGTAIAAIGDFLLLGDSSSVPEFIFSWAFSIVICRLAFWIFEKVKSND